MTPRRFDPSRHVERLESTGRYLRQPPELVLPFLPSCPGEDLAELGCGTGFFGRVLARYHRHRFYLGLDPSERLLERFRDSLEPDLRPRVIMVRHDPRGIPLRSGSVRVLLLANVLHELLADSAIVPEISRVLAPGGRLCVIDWKKRPTLIGPPFFLRVSRRSAAELFRSLGFVPGPPAEVYDQHYCLLFTKT